MRDHRRLTVVCLILIAITLAVFLRTLGNGFVFDDMRYITENRHVRNGLSIDGVRWAFTSTYAANWHPLTWISHMTDVSLYGLKPAGHHLTNLILHVLNVLLLFLILLSLTSIPSGNPESAFAGAAADKSGIQSPKWARCAFVAALFAIHPLHVESVAWVAERKDVLSTFFFLLTIHVYVSYARKPAPVRYLPVIVLFALGLTAKPMLVTLPFVLLLLDYWPLGRLSAQLSAAGPDLPSPNTHHLTPDTDPPLCPLCLCGSSSGSSTSTSKILLEKMPFVVLALASCMMTWVAQHGGGTIVSLVRYPVSLRVGNALVAYVSYIAKTVWPSGLSAFYPHPGDSLPVWQIAGAAALLAFITTAVIRIARRKPYLAVGWLWYLGTLVPVIGLVQVGDQAMADRYTYVPLIGLFLMVAWGGSELLKGRKGEREKGRADDAGTGRRGDAANAEFRTPDTRNPKPVTEERTPNTQHLTPTLAPTLPLGVAVLIILSAIAWRQTEYWHDNMTLFRHALAVSPRNYLAHNNIGAALEDRGEYDAAVKHYRQAVRFRPRAASLRSNLAHALSKSGRQDEAVQEYRMALDINPNHAESHNNLGVILEQQGIVDEAVEHYGKAVQIDPSYVDAHNNLGNALYQDGRLDEGIAEYQEALSIDPTDARAHYNIAVALQEQGSLDAAIAHYRQAIASDPGNGQAHNNLAVALYSRGDYAEAWKEVRLARKYGRTPSPGFLKALSERMADPSR